MTEIEKVFLEAEEKGFEIPEFFKYVPDNYKQVVGIAILKQWFTRTNKKIVIINVTPADLGIQIGGGVLKDMEFSGIGLGFFEGEPSFEEAQNKMYSEMISRSDLQITKKAIKDL